MYPNNNKGLTFVEVITSISIILFIGSILFGLTKPVYKTFSILYHKHTIEKKVVSLKYLISNHLFWTKQREIRIFTTNNNTSLPTFSEIFSKPSENSGNILAIKYYFYDKNEKNILKKLQIKYRCFIFIDNKASLAYFDAHDLPAFSGVLNSTIILENCDGKFFYKDKVLKLELSVEEKNKGVENLGYIFFF